MAYLYEGGVGDDRALVAPTPASKSLAELIRPFIPLLALLALGLIIWYVLKKGTRKNPRRRRGTGGTTRTLGSWDPKQASETRHRELRRLVNEDGYAKVVRRLTLTKNNNKSLKSIVDQDLDYLAVAEGRMS